MWVAYCTSRFGLCVLFTCLCVDFFRSCLFVHPFVYEVVSSVSHVAALL